MSEDSKQPEHELFGRVNVRTCARCDHDHESVEFYWLSMQGGEFDAYGFCPNLGEPIMLTVEQDGEGP